MVSGKNLDSPITSQSLSKIQINHFYPHSESYVQDSWQSGTDLPNNIRRNLTWAARIGYSAAAKTNYMPKNFTAWNSKEFMHLMKL